MLHKALIAGMAMDPASNTPIIILKTEVDDHVVPIWIGLLEATSIAAVLKEVAFERPMTHDLFKNFLDQVGLAVKRVEICDIRDNTYYARIHFAGPKTDEFVMDARPSDAIAMALRFQAPLYVDDQVLEKSQRDPSEAEVHDQTEEGQKWAEYLANLSPEDIGKA
jgi:bifunctional DNase/RNase